MIYLADEARFAPSAPSGMISALDSPFLLYIMLACTPFFILRCRHNSGDVFDGDDLQRGRGGAALLLRKPRQV